MLISTFVIGKRKILVKNVDISRLEISFVVNLTFSSLMAMNTVPVFWMYWNLTLHCPFWPLLALIRPLNSGCPKGNPLQIVLKTLPGQETLFLGIAMLELFQAAQIIRFTRFNNYYEFSPVLDEIKKIQVMSLMMMARRNVSNNDSFRKSSTWKIFTQTSNKLICFVLWWSK